MSNTNKYLQVETYILERIRSRDLLPGEQIPTEKQLQEKFGLSRMTVNKALNHLAEAGYLKRTPGKGSFVSLPKAEKKMHELSSFDEDMKRIGRTPGTQLLRYEVIPAETYPEAKNALCLRDSDLIHHFIQLRTGDGKPYGLSSAYVSVSVIGTIDVGCLNGSFSDYLKRLSLMPSRIDHCLSAELPSEEEKELLQIENNAVLRHTCTAFVKQEGREIPFLFSVDDYNGSLYTYRISTDHSGKETET